MKNISEANRRPLVQPAERGPAPLHVGGLAGTQRWGSRKVLPQVSHRCGWPRGTSQTSTPDAREEWEVEGSRPVRATQTTAEGA